MEQNELTPLANMNFDTHLADAVNTLSAVNRTLTASGDKLADWVLTNRICLCRPNFVCSKCEVLEQWEQARRGR